MNIYEKMLAITDEIACVAKNLRVGEGRNEYKAVGEADVLAAVKPLEAKHKIYSYPREREIIATDVMTTEKEYKGNVTKSNKLFLRVKTTYRFVNAENPEEHIEITTYGDGVDSQDKAPGKAMTYADKYALLKAYKIMTGDDPDQTASENGMFRSAYTDAETIALQDAVLERMRGDVDKANKASMQTFRTPFFKLNAQQLTQIITYMDGRKGAANGTVGRDQAGTETP